MDGPSLGSANATGLEKLLPKAIVEKRRRKKMRQKLERELDGQDSDGESESMDGSEANRRSWMSTASMDFQQQLRQQQQHQEEEKSWISDEHRVAKDATDTTDTAPGNDGAAAIDS